jgi:hypothetical protein
VVARTAYTGHRVLGMLDCLWGLLDGVNDAVRVLRRVPVHMSYNVTVLDRSGEHVTAYLAPDRPARVTNLAAATNHQGEVEWAPRGLPAAPAVRHSLSQGLRNPVHGRVPARRGHRALTTGRPHLGAFPGPH